MNTDRAVTHPLLDVLEQAARGSFPPVDGDVTYLPELPGGQRAIVALTGHAYIAAPLVEADLADLAPDGMGGALAPEVILRVGAGGVIGVNDVTLTAAGTGEGLSLPATDRWNQHQRVIYARHLRRDVRVFGDERGFITLSNGLAGRNELSIELTEPGRDAGHGRRLLSQALGAFTPGEHLFAAVAPGNARSLRSFLAAGFSPIGSEIIISAA